MTRAAATSWDHIQSLKEVARHVLVRLRADRLLSWRRMRHGQATEHLGPRTAAARFVAAYEAGAWVAADDQGSRSGIGSELEATAAIRDELPGLLAGLGCSRLVDVGCGDWHWMGRVELPCEYVGVDVVPAVIESNRRHERPGVRFELRDATRDPLPTSDVALCREVLFHLSFDDARAVLRNIGRTSRWLLATTDTAIWFNSDIRSGDFRRINLRRPPFSFPTPALTLRDDAVSRGRVLALWACEDLPAVRA
jgi:SAM-dependent methyltransferase